jgi:hypothetical protein
LCALTSSPKRTLIAPSRTHIEAAAEEALVEAIPNIVRFSTEHLHHMHSRTVRRAASVVGPEAMGVGGAGAGGVAFKRHRSMVPVDQSLVRIQDVLDIGDALRACAPN